MTGAVTYHRVMVIIVLTFVKGKSNNRIICVSNCFVSFCKERQNQQQDNKINVFRIILPVLFEKSHCKRNTASYTSTKLLKRTTDDKVIFHFVCKEKLGVLILKLGER